MVEVKICGLCRVEDAAAAVAAGADYVGVVLAPGFRRTRSPESAAEIFAAAAGAARVGVFVDAPAAEVAAVAGALELDVVQLHGEEAPETAVRVRDAGEWRVWKGLRPRSAAQLAAWAGAWEEAVDGLLVDGWSPLAVGGAGARLAWEELAPARAGLPKRLRIVAAGGLTPANVGAAVSVLRPDVADVSSGVELSVGAKHAGLVRDFVAAVRSAGGAAEPAREHAGSGRLSHDESEDATR